MRVQPVIHLLKGMIRLSPIMLEEKLSEANLPLHISSIFIDLSQVRFAELGGMAKLLLTIESYFKREADVFLALPTPELTVKEEISLSYPQDLANRIAEKRARVNRFLKTCGFVRACSDLSKLYNRPLNITESYHFESKFSKAAFASAYEELFQSVEIETFNYRLIYPFTWIDCKASTDVNTLLDKSFDKLLSDEERGLEKIDVQSIRNVILSELIKNVNEHSGTRYALLGIGLIASESITKRNTRSLIDPLEQSYIDWLDAEHVGSQVEIYFGDSGDGILTRQFIAKAFEKGKQGDSAALQWAFERWSTLKHEEPRRGTKGLYRIKRLVNKYDGIVQLSTDLHNGVYQRGGLSDDRWSYRRAKSAFKGTFVQIRLCPFSEIRQFKFRFSSNQQIREWKTIKYTLDDPKVLPTFQQDVKSAENMLIILDAQNLSDVKAKAHLEALLPELSFFSHPVGIVVYILSNINNNLLDTIVDSTNEVIVNKAGQDVFQDIADQNSEETYDPVLVFGNDSQVFWYGGSSSLIEILNEAYRGVEIATLDQLDSFQRLETEFKEKIRVHLKADNRLVRVDNDLKISFDFSDIDTFFRNRVLQSLENSERGAFCTPKLEIVDRWLDVQQMLRLNYSGFALTLYLLFRKYHSAISLIPRDSYILIEESGQKELARAFSSLIGINFRNIKIISEDVDPKVPRRIKLFPENATVIVLTTIISSSETIRRLVKFVKRDSAEPIAVLAIANYRKENVDAIETWTESTPIYAILKSHSEADSVTRRDDDYLRAKSHKLHHANGWINGNKIVKEKTPLSLIDSELCDIIVKRNALAYHHVGVYKDRHFTFYFDKKKLLEEESILWNRFKTHIEAWKKYNGITDLVILIPENLTEKDSPFYRFLLSFSSKVTHTNNSDLSYSYANIAYIDFGIITGNTVSTVIQKAIDVDNLYFLILFDQSLNEQFELYRRIASLNNTNGLKKTNTNVAIEFLYKFPLEHYTSENCPICEHIRALDFYKVDLDYIYKFSEDRQKRLKLAEWEDLHEESYPVDFYYDVNSRDHELSSKLVIKMFKLFLLLRSAERDTTVRPVLFDYILDLSENIDNYIKDSDSELFAVLYYLSHEINWLQKDPLVFRDLREMLSKIAFRIAIISIPDFENILSKSNTSHCSPSKLAVRYKYCAVSLLRTVNKLKFCESIFDQVKSSRKANGSFSDNLLQNIFYHTLSLFKNKYNKSSAYFNSIGSALDRIQSQGYEFSERQKAVFDYIETFNNIRNDSNDLKNIKSLKLKYDQHYASNHPSPETYLQNMDLSEFAPEGLADIATLKDRSPYLVDLRYITIELEENWRRVSRYITATIQIHTRFFSEAFKKSTFFQSLFFDDATKGIIDGNYKFGFTDRFTRMVLRINQDPQAYLLLKEEYDKSREMLASNFISKQSQFALLIREFPSDLLEIINFRFNNAFQNIEISAERPFPMIFYPQVKLKEHFHQIIENIERRLDDAKSLKDVLVRFDVSTYEHNQTDYIQLCISYDSTSKKNNEPNPTGGLSMIKSELEKFGGDLNYDTQTDEIGFFNLKFSFVRHE